MRIVVTGADGFLGRNLRLRLGEQGQHEVASVTRATTPDELRALLTRADFVYHLAGVNRPPDAGEFQRVNAEFTGAICAVLSSSGRRTPVVYASSTQAALDNPYGRSKREGELALERYAAGTGAATYVFRLPNVFGKWSRPNYNSAVATFCHNVARGLPIEVHDGSAALHLVYVDDVVDTFVGMLDGAAAPGTLDVTPAYATTVGDVARIIRSFAESRRHLTVPTVGAGLTRALYATYMSFLPPHDFAYDLQRKSDARGTFVEILKTTASGQFSYFTAPPGVTRGEHYHHSKTEKFLIVKGRARFGFRHVLTNERHEVEVDDSVPQIVETVPGWIHNISNIGASEMVVMVWANEVFDPARPDTISAKVGE